MSNKNLKVYKMQFITEVKKMYFNVKFACQIKMAWKRSSQVAQTTLVPLQNGIVDFNQTLRLNVSMYLDTNTNKFVEKKCVYSFMISTEKGQKSAGSVVIDLAQFFNRRVYEMDDSFALEKCPVAGTKVQMKIHYEQSTQQGYDSRSQISAIDQHDSSVMSMDLADLNPGGSNISEKNSEQQTEKSSKSDVAGSEKEVHLKKQQQNLQILNASDVIQYPLINYSPSKGTKIGENIKSINNLTTKINDFVNNKSKNIKFEIEGYKRNINQLEQQVRAERIEKTKLFSQLQEEKKRSSDVQRQYMNYRTEIEHKLQIQMKRSQQFEQKCTNSQKMLAQLQGKMSQNGESQNVYIEQLKANITTSEKKFHLETEELRQAMMQEKKIKNELNSRVSDLQRIVKELKSKLNTEQQKTNNLEQSMRRKQEELQDTRINLQKVYENLVNSLNGIA